MVTKLADDIEAPPLSSSEDEALPKPNINGAGASKKGKRRQPEDAEEQAPAPQKRARTTAIRTSKRTAAKQPSPERLPARPPQSSASGSDFLDAWSQSSQQRKPRVKYGKSNSYNGASSQSATFMAPDDVPQTPRKSQGGSFKMMENTPSTRNRTPKTKTKNLEIPSSAESKENIPIFQLPDDSKLSASPTGSTTDSKIFDEATSKANRTRSSSTSSLSSVDSVTSLQLTQRQKDEIHNASTPQVPVPRGSIRCPLCQKIVTLSKYPNQSNVHDQPLRAQQKFCHRHRVDDAHEEWKLSNYPTIDWDILEQQKIPQYIPHLRQILYRKQPSFYLDHLESKLKEAKNNQSKIRRYLATEIVEIVKPGYYGPKGAKVMGNRITMGMSNHLKRSLKADKTVRAVGVSGFVSAVLLPELLLRIVMDDMDIDEEDEARKVVADGTEVGMLLWSDDDHVVRDEDEDEGGVVDDGISVVD